MGTEIKVDVSAEVTKDTLMFLQRVLGPVAEASDLFSDKIRFWRWQSAIKTVERARQIIEDAGIEPREVPLKFLVPFLEKCSLENGDSLTEAWAALLASATEHYDDKYVKYAELLSHLGEVDVVLLAQMKVGTAENDVFRPERFSAPSWRPLISPDDIDYNVTLRAIDPSRLSEPGRLVYIYREDDIPNTNEFNVRDFPEALRLQLLQSLGLAFFHTDLMQHESRRYFCILAELTPLGFDFVTACEGPASDR